MLALIPLAGVLVGVYAAYVVGWRPMLLLWLGTIATIVGTHAFFWRDVYWPQVFEPGLSAPLMSATVDTGVALMIAVLMDRGLLWIVTGAAFALGLMAYPALRQLRRPARAVVPAE